MHAIPMESRGESAKADFAMSGATSVAGRARPPKRDINQSIRCSGISASRHRVLASVLSYVQVDVFHRYDEEVVTVGSEGELCASLR